MFVTYGLVAPVFVVVSVVMSVVVSLIVSVIWIGLFSLEFHITEDSIVLTVQKSSADNIEREAYSPYDQN